VLEETYAQSGAFMCAFYYARDVGEDYIPVIMSQNAEIRNLRGERIRRDLGPSVRNGQKARLAGVGKPTRPISAIRLSSILSFLSWQGCPASRIRRLVDRVL